MPARQSTAAVAAAASTFAAAVATVVTASSSASSYLKTKKGRIKRLVRKDDEKLKNKMCDVVLPLALVVDMMASSSYPIHCSISRFSTSINIHIRSACSD